MTTLEARGLAVGYADAPVLEDVSLVIPEKQITVIVGANASGKSTMLRTLARLLPPSGGAVLLDGRDIHRLSTREVALRLGILPQSASAPEGLTVFELVAQGRYPHQRWFRQYSDQDEAAIDQALNDTRTADLAYRPLDTLSGGQRQRVWLAMALAQDPEVLLLDEPTTYLDVANQLEILNLLRDLNQREGRTIAMVLHDVNQAARYAHHLVGLHRGRIVAAGTPQEILTAQLMHTVFGLESRVIPDPVTGTPMCIPIRPTRSGHDRRVTSLEGDGARS
jgi:iron complex transport system ATP-binding protein